MNDISADNPHVQKSQTSASEDRDYYDKYRNRWLNLQCLRRQFIILLGEVRVKGSSYVSYKSSAGLIVCHSSKMLRQKVSKMCIFLLAFATLVVAKPPPPVGPWSSYGSPGKLKINTLNSEQTFLSNGKRSKIFKFVFTVPHW